MSRLDDTSRCPLADRCERCGGTVGLAVATAETPVGVYCLTLCGRCGEEACLPRFLSWPAAVDRSLRHAIHLGIDADEAARLLEEER